MLPIYVMWDSRVDKFEQQAIIDGLEEFKKYLPGREIVIFGSKKWSEGDYSSADWYIEKAKRIKGQISAPSILDLMSNEPWQKANPHVDVFFVSHDLSAPGLNYCFGMSRGKLTVQSILRYRMLPSNDRYLSIKAVVQHELGHTYGLAGDLRRSNTEYKLGSHCTNYGCVMRQGMNLVEWAQHARDAHKMGRPYCNQCIEDAKRSVL